MTTGTKGSTEQPAPAGVWETISLAPLAAKTILLGVLLNRLTGFLNIFLVLFLTAKGFSVGNAAVAVGVYGAGSVVSYLIGGTLADRLGPRLISMVSMVSSAVLIVVLLYSPSFALILVVVALAGIASQVWWPSSATLLSDLTAEHRQVMILALYRLAVNVGSAAAPLIGVTIYNLDRQQYTYVFLLQAVFALLYGILAFTVLPRSRPGLEASPESAPGATDVVSGGYLSVLRDRRYVIYLAAAFFYTAVYMQYLSTLPLDIQQSGVSVFWYTVVVSLNGVIVIALELPLTKVAQRWPMRLSVCIAFTLVGLGMATYGLPLAPVVIVLGTVIWTFGEMIGAPSVFAYPAIAGPVRLKSFYIGTFQFVFGLATAVGQTVGVALYSVLGHAVWPVLAIGSVLSVICAFVALRPPLPAEIRRAEAAAGNDEPAPADVPVPATVDAARDELTIEAPPTSR